MRNKPERSHQRPGRKGNVNTLLLALEACGRKYGRALTFNEFRELEPEAHAMLFGSIKVGNKEFDPKNLQTEEERARQGVRATFAELFLSSLAKENPLVDEGGSKIVSSGSGVDGSETILN